MKRITRFLIFFIIISSAIFGQEKADSLETLEEVKARLKANVIKEENGDVRLEIKPYKYYDNPLKSVDYKGSWINESVLPYILYLDPNMDYKTFIEGLPKSSPSPWLNGLVAYFKDRGFKKSKFDNIEEGIKKISDKTIQESIDDGIPIFTDIKIVDDNFYIALKERNTVRKASKNINDWIIALKKFTSPIKSENKNSTRYRYTYIMGYNKKSKEFLLKMNPRNDDLDMWITSQELRTLGTKDTCIPILK